jgi:integrase
MREMIKQCTDKKGKKYFVVQAYGRDRYSKSVRRRRILKNDSKAAAKKLERELIEELAALNQGLTYAGMTYQDFLIKEFYPYVDEQFPTEYHNLYTSLNKHAAPIMQFRIETINSTDIKEILDVVSDTVTVSTARKIRSFLKRSFDYAMQGGLSCNPVSAVKIDKKNCKEVEPGVLTREEIKILLTKAKILKPDWYSIWAISLFTGLRVGELIALKKQDCSLQDKMISVNKSWNKRVGIKSTKSGRWRKVPIADNLVPLLQPMLLGPPNEPLIKMNYVLKKGDQARVIRQFSQGIGITSIKHHDLRATFITQLFAAGASIAEVQSIVGHSDLKVTQRYLRLSGVNVAGVTNKLDFTLPSERINNVVNIFGT